MKTQKGRMAYIRAMSTSLMPMSFMWMVRYGMMAKEAPLKKNRVNLSGNMFMLIMFIMEPVLDDNPNLPDDIVLFRDLGVSSPFPLASSFMTMTTCYSRWLTKMLATRGSDLY